MDIRSTVNSALEGMPVEELTQLVIKQLNEQYKYNKSAQP
jgi:hypothetical protein